jgi:hypothetical protein
VCGNGWGRRQIRGEHGRKAVGTTAEAGVVIAECVVELGVQLSLLYRFAEEAVWAASDGREGFPILRNLAASKCAPSVVAPFGS